MRKLSCQVFSDLHYEFYRDKGTKCRRKHLRAHADVAILAGDIAHLSNMRGTIRDFTSRFKHVLMVVGNHEHYDYTFAKVREVMRGIEDMFPNFHFLDRDLIEIEGTRFLGCTLWFPLTPQALERTHHSNDFDCIQGFREQVHAEHLKCVRFLEREVREGDVVITHHAPSPKSRDSRHAKTLDCFYIHDMEYLMRRAHPQLWFHGHMHQTFHYQIGKTDIVCNPYGYHQLEVNVEFNLKKIVQVMAPAPMTETF